MIFDPENSLKYDQINWCYLDKDTIYEPNPIAPSEDTSYPHIEKTHLSVSLRTEPQNSTLRETSKSIRIKYKGEDTWVSKVTLKKTRKIPLKTSKADSKILVTRISSLVGNMGISFGSGERSRGEGMGKRKRKKSKVKWSINLLSESRAVIPSASEAEKRSALERLLQNSEIKQKRWNHKAKVATRALEIFEGDHGFFNLTNTCHLIK